MRDWSLSCCVVCIVKGRLTLLRDRLAEHLAPVSRAATTREKDIFIVSPFNNSHTGASAGRWVASADGAVAVANGPPLLVADAPIVVRVWLANPLAVALDVDSVQLSTSGVPFDPIASAVTLPPRAAGVALLLRGYVRAGTVVSADDALVVRGLHVRVCGVRCEQLVSPFGNGVAPETFARIAPDIYERAPPGLVSRCAARRLSPVDVSLPLQHEGAAGAAVDRSERRVLARRHAAVDAARRRARDGVAEHSQRRASGVGRRCRRPA